MKMALAKSSVVVVAAMVMVALVSSVAAVPGIATFYTPPYTPSSCFGFEDRGVIIAAAGGGIWDNRAACGRRYRVSCTGGTNDVPNPCRSGSVTVTIVDFCPGCASRGVTMDLSQEVFARIANPDAGRIRIDYTRV
ncbi:EG45-like domain containing protein [Zingiber officinale]|uniref:EG45-like domain containing protein n=1 Tax=Zingiber officinale TaxID=94328 RepID=UPI001C4AD143|nr:EG45-like domain containing protein [Zingiber officinale]XP_042430011.1 EG45-like domain containing protein [Zingiber officinale]